MAMRRPPAVARVLERVTATVRRHEQIGRGDRVLAAVSGGPDSVCLLYSLWHLRRLLGHRLEVFHFDHRLRPDSGADAAYVRRLCTRLGVPVHVETAQDRPATGVSVEAWAATARMRAADGVSRRVGADLVAEGHTLDDQAETVLLNLLRGTGLEGIAGIDPGTRERGPIQPLLDVERAEVEAFCRSLGLRPRRDPMNEDRRLLRAAIRWDVIPAIEQATGRGVKGSLARTAGLLRQDRDELAAAARRASTRVVDAAGGDIRFDAAALRALPSALASRVVRLAVYDALPPDAVAPWSLAAIDAVLDLARGRPGRRRDLADGFLAVRDRTHVMVTRRA
jgi:tRNA(Ile)-lysidine synthase